MTQGRASLGTAIAVMMSTVFLLPSFPAGAQSAGPSASESARSAGSRVSGNSGEELFAKVCQGCHMSDGKGATGAGTYPSLAGNGNLQASGYAIGLVVNGQRAMPPFGTMMSDDQVAAVVNYVRTHFDNRYLDAVTAEDVRAVRR
jgi:mono/diheme cytochrome c family protein